MEASKPLQEIQPKNARSKRALAKRAPLAHENPKTTLFLRASKCSELCQLLLRDLNTLKQPLAIRFTKKNGDIHPFDDPSSLEFFSRKNDASLIVFGSHSKKRPHALTFVRMFEHTVLDMLELLLAPDSFRTLSQFKNKRKAGVALKPLLAFQGAAFESPTANGYTLAKSMLLDFFKGADVDTIDVEGLQYVISVSVGDEVVGQAPPMVRIRAYLIQTKKSGSRLPRVEVEEMGPRIDFRIGRIKEADPDMMKEAMKKPRGIEPKVKKNIVTDLIGDKVGRIHVGKQDLKNMQSRKMKGLKRSRGGDEDDVEMNGGGDAVPADEMDAMKIDAKRARV